MSKERPKQTEPQRKNRGPYEKRLVIRGMTFDEAVTKIANFRMPSKAKKK
jgi:hypothetical protein